MSHEMQAQGDGESRSYSYREEQGTSSSATQLTGAAVRAPGVFKSAGVEVVIDEFWPDALPNAVSDR